MFHQRISADQDQFGKRLCYKVKKISQTSSDIYRKLNQQTPSHFSSKNNFQKTLLFDNINKSCQLLETFIKNLFSYENQQQKFLQFQSKKFVQSVPCAQTAFSLSETKLLLLINNSVKLYENGKWFVVIEKQMLVTAGAKLDSHRYIFALQKTHTFVVYNVQEQIIELKFSKNLFDSCLGIYCSQGSVYFTDNKRDSINFIGPTGEPISLLKNPKKFKNPTGLFVGRQIIFFLSGNGSIFCSFDMALRNFKVHEEVRLKTCQTVNTIIGVNEEMIIVDYASKKILKIKKIQEDLLQTQTHPKINAFMSQGRMIQGLNKAQKHLFLQPELMKMKILI